MAERDARTSAVTLRLLTTADAIRPVEQVQRDVWGFDDVEIVPLHVLLTAARHGGLLIGAYRNDRLVGFTFGYRGVDVDGTPVLCSHLLAVAPDVRRTGIGRALKWAQHGTALAHGLTRIVWTFDPLEHGNAQLNLGRLGGVTNRYIPDLYGELRDELNAGLPTDRLEIVWPLDAERVRERAPLPAPMVVEADTPLAVATPFAAEHTVAEATPEGPLLDPEGPGGPVATPDGAPRIRLRALAHAQHVRRDDPQAAMAWRLHLRRTLTGAFEAGYVLTSAGVGQHGAEFRLALPEIEDVELPPYSVASASH